MNTQTKIKHTVDCVKFAKEQFKNFSETRSHEVFLIIKEAKEEFGDVHSINANEFEMNDMIFGLCEVLGLIDFQKAQLPAYLN